MSEARVTTLSTTGFPTTAPEGRAATLHSTLGFGHEAQGCGGRLGRVGGVAGTV